MKVRSAIFNKTVLAVVAIVLVLGCLAGGANYFIAQKVEQINAQQEENAQLNGKIDELKKTIEELNEKLAQKESENASLQQKVNEQQATIDQKAAEINKINSQLEKAKQSLIKNSNLAKPGDNKSGNKVCYLTFDDGPSAATPTLLKQLDKLGVKATFFVVNTPYLDDYLDDIYNAGHAIALHCNSHEWKTVYASPQAYYNDLQTIDDLVYKYIGVRTKLIRFPGGSNNTVSKKYCTGIMTEVAAGVQIRGYRYFDWNVNSGDASGIKYTAKQIASNVVKSAKNKGDICVLMHDAKSKKTTVEALPSMVEQLINMGYRFEVLTETSPEFYHKIAN